MAYAAAPWTVRNAALGNSEGLLVALALAAVDRHAAGAPRAAFGLGLGAALLRPEAWPLLGLYGAWLAWRDAGARLLVAAGLAAIPICWMLPELWGSGDPLRAMHRARDPRAGSPAFADDPVGQVLRQFWNMLTVRLWWGGAVLLAIGLAARAPTRAELRLAGALLAGGVIWVAEVARMTSDGFSGNTRYLVLPAALACVLVGAGAGWALRAVRAPGAPAAIAAVAGVALAVGRGPPGSTASGTGSRTTRGSRTAWAPCWPAREARRSCWPAAIPTPGRSRCRSSPGISACTSQRVQLDPRTPAVVLRTRDRPGGRAVPTLAHLGDAAAQRTLAAGDGWRVVVRCRGDSAPGAEAAR